MPDLDLLGTEAKSRVAGPGNRILITTAEPCRFVNSAQTFYLETERSANNLNDLISVVGVGRCAGYSSKRNGP
jgi:hypothetical protein